MVEKWNSNVQKLQLVPIVGVVWDYLRFCTDNEMHQNIP